MSVRAISLIPNTLDFKATLKRFKGYYCADKIRIQKRVLTNDLEYQKKQYRKRLASIS